MGLLTFNPIRVASGLLGSGTVVPGRTIARQTPPNSQNEHLMVHMGMGAPSWGVKAGNQGYISHARRIANEELARNGGLNDVSDAERHARWAYRMAKEINPTVAQIIYTGHEIDDTIRGQPFRELVMDMHNNSVGLTAARAGRSIPKRNDRNLVILDNRPGRFGYKKYPKY